MSASVAAYEALIKGELAAYLARSRELGGDLAKQADSVESAFKAQKDFLLIAANCKKPANDNDLMTLLKSTSAALEKVGELRRNRSDLSNHVTAICESISALGWVTVAPTPGPFVQEMVPSFEFYGNKVLREYKDKDPKHVEWVKMWKEVMTGLIAFIKQWHTTGLVWNAQGADPMTFDVAAGGGAKSAAKRPPPPPPKGGPPPPMPPPAPAAPVASSSSSSSGGGAAALFEQINKGGTGITSGLRKVTSDMKTKNRPESERSAVVAPVVPAAVKKPAPAAAAAVVKPPSVKLDGNKWFVEYVSNDKCLVDDTSKSQAINIYQCTKAAVTIKGKVTAVAVDKCKRTALIFDGAVAGLELVNCADVEVQVNGAVPSITVDNSVGVSLYLSESATETSVITSKSSAVNVLLMKPDGDAEEFSVPEQLQSSIVNGKLQTTIVQHNL